MFLKLLAGLCELSWEIRFFISLLFLLGYRFGLFLGFLFIDLRRAHLKMVVCGKPRVLIYTHQVDSVSELLEVPFRLGYQVHRLFNVDVLP